MSKGSTWNIWDLHVHTPYSILNNQFGDPERDDTWENYVSKLEEATQAKGVVAIGVTDYFTIDGYKRLVEFQSQGRLNGLLLLPNIEFRIDKVVYKTKGIADPKRLNLHVILSPTIPAHEIEEGFLHDLDFVYESEPFEPTQTRKLKESNLIKFGSLLQQQHPRFRDQKPFETGCVNAVVQAEEIKRRLDNRFRGDYLLVLAEENISVMDWDSQHHAVRKQLIQMSHAIFSSSPKTRNWCLGTVHATPQQYIEEFKSLKPCIWGCDSHGYESRFLEPDDRRYCWIKGEVSWDGLKQILFEPAERVRIQPDSPESAKSMFTVDKIRVSRSQVNEILTINNVALDVNPNLVAIIGGRGSGKTALLDLVAVCFHEGNKLAGLDTSFFHRLYGDHKDRRRRTSDPIDVELGFLSGATFRKSVGSDDGCFEEADILYLTQNHFEEFSANPDNLNRHILDLVFDTMPDERHAYRTREEEIEAIEQRIQGINLEIEQTQSQIKGRKVLEDSDRKFKEGEMADIARRIEDVEAKEGGKDDTVLELTARIEELKSTRRRLQNVLSLLAEFGREIREFQTKYGQSVQPINNELGSFGLEEPDHLPVELPGLVDVLSSIEATESTLERQLDKVDTESVVVEKEVSVLQGISKTIADLRQKSSDVAAQIGVINQRIDEIDAKAQRIVDLDKERFELYDTLLRKTIDLRQFLQSTIDEFENGKDAMLSRLSFSAVIDTRQRRKYIEALATKVDGRKHSEADILERLGPMFEEMDTLFGNEEPKEVFSEITEQLRDVGLTLTRKASTTESDFHNTLLQRCFGIGLGIGFDGRNLDELSMGERAVVLLKILLAHDDKPLLIDQPEEHLDNRYIYNELTPAFRNAKQRRQIIIATHNANLVVNTDAEQIVVAENLNGTLSYKVGTLEDAIIREEIKAILEGGDEAFKKREEKYGYKF